MFCLKYNSKGMIDLGSDMGVGDITLEVDMSIQKKTCTGMTRFGKGRGW
jgi:hypothetical protein